MLSNRNYIKWSVLEVKWNTRNCQKRDESLERNVLYIHTHTERKFYSIASFNCNSLQLKSEFNI